MDKKTVKTPASVKWQIAGVWLIVIILSAVASDIQSIAGGILHFGRVGAIWISGWLKTGTRKVTTTKVIRSILLGFLAIGMRQASYEEANKIIPGYEILSEMPETITENEYTLILGVTDVEVAKFNEERVEVINGRIEKSFELIDPETEVEVILANSTSAISKTFVLTRELTKEEANQLAEQKAEEERLRKEEEEAIKKQEELTNLPLSLEEKIIEKYKKENLATDNIVVAVYDRNGKLESKETEPPYEVVITAWDFHGCYYAKNMAFFGLKAIYTDKEIGKDVVRAEITIMNHLRVSLGKNDSNFDRNMTGPTNFWKIISQYSKKDRSVNAADRSFGVSINCK